MKILISDDKQTMKTPVFDFLIKLGKTPEVERITLIDGGCKDDTILDRFLPLVAHAGKPVELLMITDKELSEKYLNKIIFYRDTLGLHLAVTTLSEVVLDQARAFNIKLKVFFSNDTDISILDGFSSARLDIISNTKTEKLLALCDYVDEHQIDISLSSELIPCLMSDEAYMRLDVFNFQNDSNNIMNYVAMDTNGDVYYTGLNEKFLSFSEITSIVQVQQHLQEEYSDHYQEPTKLECIHCQMYRRQHRKCY